MSFFNRIIWFCFSVAGACGVALMCSPTLRGIVAKETIIFFNNVIILYIALGSLTLLGWIVFQLCRVVWKLSQCSDGWFAKIEAHLSVIENAFAPVGHRLSSVDYEVSQLRQKLEEIESKIVSATAPQKIEETAEAVLENAMDEFTSEVDYE